MSDNVVYSTEPSKQVLKTLAAYRNALDTYPKGDVRRAQRFLEFATACEDDNKDKFKVLEQY